MFIKRVGVGASLISLGVVGSEALRSVTTQVARPRTALNLASGVRIDNVSIVDPLDGSVRPQHSIVISGARIEAVIPTSSAATESSLRVIQGNGRFAVPGFNDIHTHVLQEPNPSSVSR